MNHIEEMMKTAGVTLIENKCQDCKYNMEECSAYYCADFKYPDFTAEKQLEVFQYLCANINYMHIETGIEDDKEYWLISSTTLSYELYEGEAGSFVQALAQLTTELMTAGELDKEKVKEILEK